MGTWNRSWRALVGEGRVNEEGKRKKMAEAFSIHV
jgi:hypothetical protein